MDVVVDAVAREKKVLGGVDGAVVVDEGVVEEALTGGHDVVVAAFPGWLFLVGVGVGVCVWACLYVCVYV